MENNKREEFNEIINSIYEKARKMDRNMQVEKESYDFLIDYGKELSNEIFSVLEEPAEGSSEGEKAFFKNQVSAYIEYYGAICSFWELCGTEIPAIEKLATDMDQVFISRIDPRN